MTLNIKFWINEDSIILTDALVFHYLPISPKFYHYPTEEHLVFSHFFTI